MLNYLLDTNICIYVIKNRPAGILEIFNRFAGQLCISSITLAELTHGVERSSNIDHNRKQLNDFTSRLAIMDYGQKAAIHYGEIRADLESRGQIIGVNDLHIAAHARSEGLTLVTNNLKEFRRVKGLLLENWA